MRTLNLKILQAVNWIVLTHTSQPTLFDVIDDFSKV